MKIGKSIFMPVLFLVLFLINCSSKKAENKKKEVKESSKELKNEIQIAQKEILSLDSLLEAKTANTSGKLKEKLNTWKDILQYLKNETNTPEFKQKSKAEQKVILHQIKAKKDSIEDLLKEVFPR